MSGHNLGKSLYLLPQCLIFLSTILATGNSGQEAGNGWLAIVGESLAAVISVILTIPNTFQVDHVLSGANNGAL
jgi:hypothetical protein